MEESALINIMRKFVKENEGQDSEMTHWQVRHLGNGNINSTFHVKMTNGLNSNEYVLQQINENVFQNVNDLMENMALICDHLRRSSIPTLELQDVIEKSSDDGPYHHFSNAYGGCWRVFAYIPDGKPVMDLKNVTAQDIYKASKAFGDFQYQLRHISVDQLHEHIPHFHDTRFRYNCLLESIENDKFGRVSDCKVKGDVEFLLEREEKYVDTLLNLRDPISLEEVPRRVVHNDTKISNVLLSQKTGEVLCVIDLDTVMPGLSLYDFADIVRSTACSAGEDEFDLSKVFVRLDMFRAAVEGYLSSSMFTGNDVEHRLWSVEVDNLFLAGQVITYEQGLRFFSDYLEGDFYYKIPANAPSDFNLQRARNQFALLRSMEKHENDMKRIVLEVKSLLLIDEF